MRRSVRRAAGLALLAVGMSFITFSGSSAADADPSVYKLALPDDVVAKLVAEDAKTVKASLEKASDKKMVNRAKVLSLLIAVYAQDAMGQGGGNPSAAGLRDTALKLAKALTAGNTAEAKKLANDLQPAGKPAPGGGAGLVPIHEGYEIDLIMQVFKPERSGGIDLEKKLQTYVNKRAAYTANDYQAMIPILYRIAAIAQPTEALAPAPMGKKTPAEWTKLSREMRTLAAETAELARKPKPDNAAVKASIKKLDANCTACHEKFRD